MNIIDYIPYGKENAIGRDDLRRRTGKPDKVNRDLMKEYNSRVKPGQPVILSSSGWHGYWKSKDILEMSEYLSESDHRRMKQAKNDEAIRKIVASAQGDDMIPVIAYLRRLHKEPEPIRQIDGQMRW